MIRFELMINYIVNNSLAKNRIKPLYYIMSSNRFRILTFGVNSNSSSLFIEIT